MIASRRRHCAVVIKRDGALAAAAGVISDTGALISTIGRSRIAVGGRRARSHGSDFCMSQAASHSWDIPAAGSPADYSSGPHRCGPTPKRGVSPATRWLLRKSRSSPTERRRDTAGCNDRGARRSVPDRIRASVSYSICAGQTPDRHCRSRFSGCASKAVYRNQYTVSRG